MAKSHSANIRHGASNPAECYSVRFSEMIRDKLMETMPTGIDDARTTHAGAHLLHTSNDNSRLPRRGGKLELREEKCQFEQIVLEAYGFAVERDATVGAST